MKLNVVDNEPKLDRYARTLAINLACQAGLESCLIETSQKLQQSLINNVEIAPDVKNAIYCNGLRRSNSTFFLQLQNKMFQSQDQSERALIISGLGCSQDEIMLTQLLNFVIFPGNALRLQEKFQILFAPVDNGDLGLRVMLNFIRNYRNSIPDQVMSILLSNIAARISSQTMLDELNLVLNVLQNSNKITETIALTCRLAVQHNFDWQKINLRTINEYFLGESHFTTTEGTTTLGSGSIMVSLIVLSVCSAIISVL